MDQLQMPAEALHRLLSVANGDSGQSRKVANFLLSWWNAGGCGGFDLTDLWGLDPALGEDIRLVFDFVSRVQRYPDTLGFKVQFDRLVADWRPHLLKD